MTGTDRTPPFDELDQQVSELSSPAQSDVARAAHAWTPSCLEMLSYDDGCLVWRCKGLDRIAAVSVDGAACDCSEWTFAADRLSVRADAIARAFDGLRHEIRVDGLIGGRDAVLTSEIHSQYTFGIEVSEDSEAAHGWVRDNAFRSRPLLLMAEVDGQSDRPVGVHGDRFTVGWDGARARQHGLTVALRVAGTTFYPFGQYRIGRPHAARPGERTIAGPFHRAQGPVRVAVIVVVDTNSADLPDRLRRLRATADSGEAEIVVIEASGTQATPGGHRGVVEQVFDAGCTCLQPAPTLQSYGEAVNAAARLRPDHDLALVDEHAVLAPGWIGRLRAAAMSRDSVAVVLPVTPGEPFAGTLTAGASARPCEAELSHAVCCYVTRAAFTAVGEIPSEPSLGAAEAQTEFMRRSSHSGWVNLVTPDVGAADGRPTPPPFRPTGLQRALCHHAQIEAWRRPGPAVLIVTHSLPGGTHRHVKQLSRELHDAGKRVLWLRATPGGELSIAQPDGRLSLAYDARTGLRELAADIFALAPSFIHVHHLIDLPHGLADIVRNCGVPYAVTVHDYFFGCPRVTLLDEGGSFCGAPAAEKCAPCLAAKPLPDAMHESLLPYATDAVVWRTAWGSFLQGAFQVIVPSHSAAYYMQLMFPELTSTVRQHTAPAETARPPGWSPAGLGEPAGTVVAAIGIVGKHKGSDRLHELIRHCARFAPDLRFVVIGATDCDDILAHYLNVEITGAYRASRVQSLIESSGCGVALFLSPCPETYSFALSEAFHAGLMPVAVDMGAIAERIRQCDRGILVMPHCSPESMVAAIRAASKAVREKPQVRIDGLYVDLFSDYYYSVPETADMPAKLGWKQGVTTDLWLGRTFSIELHLRAPVAAVELRLWGYTELPPQFGRIRVNDEAGIAFSIAPSEQTTVTIATNTGWTSQLAVSGRFEFETALGPIDRRSATAKLLSLSLTLADGRQHRLDLNEGAAPSMFQEPVAMPARK